MIQHWTQEMTEASERQTAWARTPEGAAEIKRRQDEFNADPEKVAAFWARRKRDKQRRQTAETEYYGARQKRGTR